MSLFSETLKQDLNNCFLNTDEFAEEVTFEGQRIKAIVDDGSALYQGQEADGFGNASGLGLIQGDRTLCCNADALSKRPFSGQRVTIDGTLWLVGTVAENGGMLRIVLNRAYA